jgi:hypothetical protein
MIWHKGYSHIFRNLKKIELYLQELFLSTQKNYLNIKSEVFFIKNKMGTTIFYLLLSVLSFSKNKTIFSEKN